MLSWERVQEERKRAGRKWGETESKKKKKKIRKTGIRKKKKENLKKKERKKKKKSINNLKINKTKMKKNKKIKKYKFYKKRRKKLRGYQWKGKLIIGRCQSPLRQPAECGCAITEPDYRHPAWDGASQSRSNVGPRNGRTGKTVWIFCRGGHIENPGQVMFTPGVCGELGNLSIYHRRERNGEVSWYKPCT